MKTKTLSALVCMVAIQAHSMTVREALGQIESGANDSARGKSGEVSRYQIKPAVWQCFSKSTDYTNEPTAWQVAFQIIEARTRGFVSSYHRPPTSFEVYVLWNAPAQIARPSHVVSERATRFANLINSTKHQ